LGCSKTYQHTAEHKVIFYASPYSGIGGCNDGGNEPPPEEPPLGKVTELFMITSQSKEHLLNQKRANTAPLRGIFDVHPTGGGRRVFACACGTVQAGSLCGLKLVPAKQRCLSRPVVELVETHSRVTQAVSPQL